MMTACPQCDRLVDGAKPRCLYCGAALTPAGQLQPAAGSGTGVDEDLGAGTVNLNDLPPELRQQVEDAIRIGNTGILPEPSARETPLPESTIASVLTAICKLKESFDADRIDYDEYRTLTIDTLMQYVETLEVHNRMNFVFREIQQSELQSYIDEPIFKALSARVLSAVTAVTDEPTAEKPKKKKRFRLFRR
ncbi:MAG TPA: hypothetical protein ACFCUC_09120 [Desulfobacterales bacterium]